MKKRKAQAVIFYYAEDNKKHFLLLRMNDQRNGYWQNVTGKVEKSETFKEGALREAMEETNLSLENIKNTKNLNMTFEFQDQWGKDSVEEVFAIEVFKKWPVIIDPSEHQDFKWQSEEEINTDSVHFSSNFEAIIQTLEKC